MIREVIPGQADPPIEEAQAWLGHRWIETVTPESRPRIEEMLREAAADGVSRRQQVNHLSAGGDFPVAYTTIRLKDEKQLVALGRDLTAVSALQKRVVEAQQSLEHDYWRLRFGETRYRLLYQVSAEPVLVVDGATLRVVEANPAAATLFGSSTRKLVGRAFPFDMDGRSDGAVQDLLATVRTHGRGEDLAVQLGQPAQACTLSISLARQDAQSLFLVRLLPLGREAAGAGTPLEAECFRLLQALPDAFVALDQEGRVVAANRAFLDLVELPTERQVRGQMLSRWVGRPGADLGLMLATLRQHGVIRLFSTSLRGELGSASEVEVAGVILRDRCPEIQGLLIRDIGRRLMSGPRGASDLTRAVEQLTALVGRVSLKNLVRDTADLVERHFIEAALALTNDNRTSAAEVLGVSRQSLYVKLRRYNLGPTADTATQSGRAQPKARRKRR